MKVVLIGSGNLATNLGFALKKTGCDVVQVFSKTFENAKCLAEKLECRATDNLAEVVSDADVYFFSVKDSVLCEVIASVIPNDALWVHTAGSMPISVFEPYHKRAGVLYPMQTFGKKRMADFQKIPIFIEAVDDADLMLLQQISEGLSEKVYNLSSEKRRYLHLSAVFACNFTNCMYMISEKILKNQGIPFDVMLSLINETADKVHEMSPVKAQTGPAIRYDVNVMQKHLELLDDEYYKRLYELTSEIIHKEVANE